MVRIDKTRLKLSLLIGIILLFIQPFPPQQICAQEPWPPFWFKIRPAYENGKITYNVSLGSHVSWQISDVTIMIPLPKGTRFVKTNTRQPGVKTEFNGQTVTIFSAALGKGIKDASLTVEVIDSATTIVTVQPWISWKGKTPGDYLSKAVAFDITRQPLNWDKPPRSHLQLGVGATVADDVITYEFYPKIIDSRQIWDLEISLPLPENAAFLSVDAPHPFTFGFNGDTVSFFAVKPEQYAGVKPLTFKVSTAETTNSIIATRAWIAWKNVLSSWEQPGRPAQEQHFRELVAPPRVPQKIVFDRVGDVPFSNYDLTSLSLQESGSALTVIFNAAGEIGVRGQPVRYTLFIDSDCNSNTGQPRKFRGAEYRVSYNHAKGRASITAWDAAREDWRWSQTARLDSSVDGKTVRISVPRKLLETIDQQFCWIGRASNKTKAFYPDPPSDWLPDKDYFQLTQYQIKTPLILSAAPLLSAPPLSASAATPTTSAQVATTPTPTVSALADINGKLAIPLINKQGAYDVRVFSLPDGREVAKISNARQPAFSVNGKKLLINHASVYASNDVEIYGRRFDGRMAAHILEYRGSAENRYEYNLVDGTEMIKGFGNGSIPRQPTQNADDIPSDQKGNVIAFTTRRDNNWEAYVMALDGANVINLSNSPNSNDGLPAISPNGKWVAFVSDRSGQWTVWVVPVTGGQAQRLFDLPVTSPWGNGTRTWVNERMSWGR